MKHTTVSAVLGVLLVAATAHAETRTHYELKGNDTKRGKFKSSITLVQRGDQIEILRWGRYPNETTFQLASTQKQPNGSLRATLRDMRGVSGVLQSFKPAAPTTVTLFIDGKKIRSVTNSPDGDGYARGKRKKKGQPVPGPATSSGAKASAPPVGAETAASADRPDDEPSRVGKLQQKGRHLLAAGEKKVKELIKKRRDELVYDGVGLERTFSFSKYLHVGVGGEIKALRQSDLTAEQALTLSQKPRHVWLSNNVHGGVRVPLSTSIPIGDVKVGVGLTAAAKVDYTVVDIYPLPAGVTDVGTVVADLKTVVKRSFDLPLDAREAERMNVGARRVFDGQGSVALSGNLSIGREITKLKREVVKIGASARVGGFYRIQGDVRITVERLKRDQVRVRVRHGKTRSRGASADLFLGATVDKSKLKDELEPVVEYIDEGLIKVPSAIRNRIVDKAEDRMANEIRDRVQKVLRIRLYAGKTKTKRDEIDVSFVMRLSKPKARRAYERAVRGDFTEASRAARDPGSGVRREFRVLAVENRTFTQGSFELSVLLKASASKDIRFSDLHVDDENGRTDYEVFDFHRKRGVDLKVFDKRWAKDLRVEVIRRTRPDVKLTEGQLKRSLQITLDHEDAVTYNAQAVRRRRIVASWGLDMASGLADPKRRGLRSRYGKTRMRIEVGISERGIAAILAKGRPAMLKAYTDAYTIWKGSPPTWDTSGRRTSLDNLDVDGEQQAEQRVYERAQDFVDGLQGLRKATTAKQRARRLQQVANSARYDLYAASALIYLAPRDTLTLDASIQGKRIRVNDGHVGEKYDVPVKDPR